MTLTQQILTRRASLREPSERLRTILDGATTAGRALSKAEIEEVDRLRDHIEAVLKSVGRLEKELERKAATAVPIDEALPADYGFL